MPPQRKIISIHFSVLLESPPTPASAILEQLRLDAKGRAEGCAAQSMSAHTPASSSGVAQGPAGCLHSRSAWLMRDHLAVPPGKPKKDSFVSGSPEVRLPGDRGAGKAFGVPTQLLGKALLGTRHRDLPSYSLQVAHECIMSRLSAEAPIQDLQPALPGPALRVPRQGWGTTPLAGRG